MMWCVIDWLGQCASIFKNISKMISLKIIVFSVNPPPPLMRLYDYGMYTHHAINMLLE